jgi:hypothetical protein
MVWEEFAVGMRIGYAHSFGQWDGGRNLRLNTHGYADGLTRMEPWSIVRLHESIQLQSWLPVLVNHRQAGSQTQTVGGVGDAGVAVRFEAISIGEYDSLPALAITLGSIFPTGRRPEETSPPLFAGTTGRGSWGGALGMELEYAPLPWFVRLDMGLTYFFPFQRPDTHVQQQYGVLTQLSLSTGMEIVPNRWVMAFAATGEWEGAIREKGAAISGSQSSLVDLALSLSWRFSPRWTWVATGNNTVWPIALGKNRDARVGTSLGIRYGYY